MIPKWPDFSIKRGSDGWLAQTDTGRPGTPIFALFISSRIGDEATARVFARDGLDRSYALAHPNGCP